MPERMQVAELERKFDGAIHELNEVEQILGQALDYPFYCDDPANFPDATAADGVCVGEMTPATLASEAARRIAYLKAQNDADALSVAYQLGVSDGQRGQSV